MKTSERVEEVDLRGHLHSQDYSCDQVYGDSIPIEKYSLSDGIAYMVNDGKDTLGGAFTKSC